MKPYLPVVDDAALTLMNKFDGIFNRNNMILAAAIGDINDCGKGCGLAASGGARDQNKSSGQQRQFGYNGRESQLLGCLNFAGDLAENSGYAIFLHKKIGPVPCKPWNLIAKIHISGFFKNLDLVFRGNLIQHAP